MCIYIIIIIINFNTVVIINIIIYFFKIRFLVFVPNVLEHLLLKEEANIKCPFLPHITLIAQKHIYMNESEKHQPNTNRVSGKLISHMSPVLFL